MPLGKAEAAPMMRCDSLLACCAVTACSHANASFEAS